MGAPPSPRFCICGYSIFGIGVDRKRTLKWIFPQEKATFTALKKSTCIPKML
jgi:hypothetical protein